MLKSLNEVINLAIAVLESHVTLLKIKRIKWLNSKWSVFRNYNRKIINFIATISLSYISAGMIYLGLMIFHYINYFVEQIPEIIRSSFLGIPYNFLNDFQLLPNIDIKLLGIIFFLLLLISFAVSLLGDKKRDMLKELAVFITTIRRIKNSLNLCKSLLIYIAIVPILTIGTYYIPIERYLPEISFNNINIIFIFWTAIFLLAYVRSDSDKRSERELVLFILFIPVTLFNIISNNIDNYIAITLMVIAIYLVFRRTLNEYVKYREKLFEGKDIFFMINNFISADYDRLYNKEDWKFDFYNKDLSSSDYETIVKSSLILIFKEEPDLDMAKYILETYIDNYSEDYLINYLLAIVLLNISGNENIQKSYQLLEESKKIQSEEGVDGIYLYETDLLIADSLFYMDKPDYNKIIDILKKPGDLFPWYKYILAVSYINTSNSKKAKKYLKEIYDYKNEIKQIPYYLLVIEWNQNNYDIELLKKYIKDCEENSIDCAYYKENLECFITK